MRTELKVGLGDKSDLTKIQDLDKRDEELQLFNQVLRNYELANYKVAIYYFSKAIEKNKECREYRLFIARA